MRQNIEVRFGEKSFKALVESEAREKTQDLSHMRSYHKSDKGEIGSNYYCKSCGEKTSRTDTLIGYKTGDKIAYFTHEELDEKFPKMIEILGPTDQVIEPRMVKAAYDMQPDNQANVKEKVNYGVTLEEIKTGQQLGALAKLHSGYRQTERPAIIRWNKETESPEVVELYYPEELKPVKSVGLDITLDPEKCRAAAQNLYGMKGKVDMQSLKEKKIAGIMESVKNRLAGREQMKTIVEKKTEDANDLLDEMLK
jgi:non-homologous end joining protein Ku